MVLLVLEGVGQLAVVITSFSDVRLLHESPEKSKSADDVIREREASLLVGLLFQLGGYQSVVSEELLAASVEVIHPTTLCR